MHDHDDERPNRRWWLGIAGASVTLLVLVWFAWRWGGPPPPPADMGRELAQGFLDDIRSNRFEAAWDRTSAEFRSAQGWGRFWRYVRTQPIFRSPVEFVTADESEVNGIKLITCTFQAPTPASQLRVVLATEGPAWKVERIAVESSAAKASPRSGG